MLLVLGILLFGRNLPDVGRQLGRTVANLRRGMQEFKDQMNRDESIREMRDTMRETRDELRRVGTVPRALANPGAALRDMANDLARDTVNPYADGNQQAETGATTTSGSEGDAHHSDHAHGDGPARNGTATESAPASRDDAAPRPEPTTNENASHDENDRPLAGG